MTTLTCAAADLPPNKLHRTPQRSTSIYIALNSLVVLVMMRMMPFVCCCFLAHHPPPRSKQSRRVQIVGSQKPNACCRDLTTRLIITIHSHICSKLISYLLAADRRSDRRAGPVLAATPSNQTTSQVPHWVVRFPNCHECWVGESPNPTFMGNLTYQTI